VLALALHPAGFPRPALLVFFFPSPLRAS